jgi:hypothetical protein
MSASHIAKDYLVCPRMRWLFANYYVSLHVPGAFLVGFITIPTG